jgi:hypothetical protein
MDGRQLRDGLFSLYTRRFGTVTELMIRRLVDLGKAHNQFHDLFDDAELHRIEVKFSVVRKAAEAKITEDTVLRCIAEATATERMVSFHDNAWQACEFDCNIQPIKRKEFHVLYYGLMFADAIAIFRIGSKEIGSQIFYSDKQHKGNEGEGQFHLNRQTLSIHLKQYLYKVITYDELLKLLS